MAGVLWGLISIFIKPLSAAGATSLQIVCVRAVISALGMLCVILIKDSSLLKIQLRDLWMFFGTGVISLTFFSLCYFTTIIECGVSIAVVLLYTSPIFILLLSLVLFKERLTFVKVIALILTFGGCVFVSGVSGQTTVSARGIFVGLLSGLGYGLYSIFSRYALKKYSSFTVTFYTFVFSGLSLLPFCHINELSGILDGRISLLLIGISILCTVLPYVFYTYGLSGLETGVAAIFVTVEPLVGTLIGFILFREEISIAKIAGIVLIFTAVILLGREKPAQNPEKEA